jgi:hypothetical protein
MSEAFWNKRGGCKSVDKKKKKVTGKWGLGHGGEFTPPWNFSLDRFVM